MLFYLGTHKPHWLNSSPFPLFISRRTLVTRKYYPWAICEWSLDSGAFSELAQYGEWRLTPKEYMREIDLYSSEIGMMRWAAPQDMMCEPFMLKKTGLSVKVHQERTVINWIILQTMNRSGHHIIPVLQGWILDDYLRHLDLYQLHGFDLTTLPLVGLGSVCRRQGSRVIELIVRKLSEQGLALHGFGVKTKGLAKYASCLVSSDSAAWSYHARYRPPLPGHTHKNCANCWDYAVLWRDRALKGVL